MSTPGWNPHKQGEHVFNDIAGSVANAFEAALRFSRVNSLILNGRYGSLQLSDFPGTFLALDQLGKNVILTEARTVTAPATGNVNDWNSRSYGESKAQLERFLSDLVDGTAKLIWSKKRPAVGSFQQFESIVSRMGDSRFLTLACKSAFSALVDAAHDTEAEAAAFAERVSDTELARRKDAINRMHQYYPAVKEFGSTLIDTFVRELETVLERRVSPA